MDSNFSSTSICNSALMKCGADLISSLDDGSRAANILSALYPTIRDAVLADAPWRFATIMTTLNAVASAPAYEYLYAYQLPNDCLRILTAETEPWTVVAGGLLYCDYPGPLNVSYIQQNTNESSWDPPFAEALAVRLARELSLALVQSVPLAQTMDKMYQAMIRDARALNAVQGGQKHLIADIWTSARKGFNYLGPITAGPPENYGP